MRKLAQYGIIVFQILLIISLVRGVQLTLRSRERVTDLEKKKAELVKEEERLKAQEEYVQSPYYLEKVAREELHLAKPGETVVIVPDSILQITDDSRQADTHTEQPNWQKWWEVLSGK